MHDISIILILSFIQLNSKDPSNLFDDCKNSGIRLQFLAQSSELTLLSQQKWSEAIVHDDSNLN
jgi:hypothetical protein